MSDELLKEQYRVAVDLYKHEDLLNWQKFNNLIYVNTALIGMAGFWEIVSNNYPKLLAIFLPVLGIIVSVCFFISIRAGGIYLQSRKEALVAIDKEIKTKTTHQAVFAKNSILAKSPTVMIIAILPMVLCLFWGVFLFCVLFYG